MTRCHSLLKVFLCMSLLFVIGCASDDGAERVLDFNDSNIKKIRNFYELYMDEHASVGPKNEATFKDYILNGRKANILKKKLNIDDTDVDGLFIGERDDEPFKIRYGLKQPLNHAIVFEATGVDGKRLVARSPIEELEADEYQAWLSGKKKPKPLPTLGQPMDESESAQ